MGLMDFKRISPTPLPPKPEPVKPKVSGEELLTIAKVIMGGVGVPELLGNPFGSTAAETLLYADSDDGVPGHYKQWSITQTGKSVTTKWGKVGATLQSNTKMYGSERMAAEMVRKTIETKRAKGYRDRK